MSLTVSNAGSATSTTSSGSLDVTGINADVDDMLVVMVSCDNSNTSGTIPTLTISDTAGNTYTGRVGNTKSGGVANDGVSNRSWTSVITTALSNGTITITFSPNTTSKAVLVKRIQPGVGESVAYGTNSGATGTSTTPSITSSSITNGHIIMGFVGIEGTAGITEDSDTTNGSWSAQYGAAANTGTAGTSIKISSQQKTVTATATQTYNVTLASSLDWAINWMSFSVTTNPTWGRLLASARNRLVQ